MYYNQPAIFFISLLRRGSFYTFVSPIGSTRPAFTLRVIRACSTRNSFIELIHGNESGALFAETCYCGRGIARIALGEDNTALGDCIGQFSPTLLTLERTTFRESWRCGFRAFCASMLLALAYDDLTLVPRPLFLLRRRRRFSAPVSTDRRKNDIRLRAKGK